MRTAPRPGSLQLYGVPFKGVCPELRQNVVGVAADQNPVKKVIQKSTHLGSVDLWSGHVHQPTPSHEAGPIAKVIRGKSQTVELVLQVRVYFQF